VKPKASKAQGVGVTGVRRTPNATIGERRTPATAQNAPTPEDRETPEEALSTILLAFIYTAA
jgi:hypothetical protein